MRQWTGAWAFYADWLDGLIGGERAFAVTDSKTVANFMSQYRRPNLVSLHVVHNSHLEGAQRPYGECARRAGRCSRTSSGSTASCSSPNDSARMPRRSSPTPATSASSRTGSTRRVVPALDRDRDPAAGVVVAGLTRRKRVGHAIDIVRECRRAGLPVTLVSSVTGADAATLRARVEDAGLADAVTFAGHRDDAAEAFATASWTLLTSTSEGSPLVLAEAMSRGCIPIAYDIPYGPADLIVDGVDGLLVPDGDRAAAAAAVARLVAMAPDERERMRRRRGRRPPATTIGVSSPTGGRATCRRRRHGRAAPPRSRPRSSACVSGSAAGGSGSPSRCGAFRATRAWSSGSSAAGAAHSCAPGGPAVTAASCGGSTSRRHDSSARGIR